MPLAQSHAEQSAVRADDVARPFGAPLPDEHSLSTGRGRSDVRRCALAAVPDLPLDFEAAVRSLTPRLQRYATRRLGDRHEAEELVQEALLRAYQNRAGLRSEDDVAAWTTCVTGRLVIDRLRVRGRSTPVADVPEGARAERDTADIVVARDQARMALDALDAMPPRQAAVLWAREVEGLAYDEIGRRFGMSEPAVRSLLTRARKALRKEYAVRGGTLPGAGLALLAPWVTGTGWLERVRSGLVSAAAPAALGVAAAGIVTGAFVLPGSWPAGEPMAPAVVRSAAPEADRGAVAARPAPAPAAPAAAEPAIPAAAPGAAAIPEPETAERGTVTRVVGGTGLTDTCVDGGSAGAGGTGCAPEAEAGTLSVDLSAATGSLPPGAAGEAPHLQSTVVECDQVPDDVPFIECTPPREDS